MPRDSANALPRVSRSVLCVSVALGPLCLRAAPAELPEKYRDADAVILDWRQSWKKSPNGEVTCRERKAVLIQNDRAMRSFADPRVTYHSEFDAIRVLEAATRDPDMPVPDYSRNLVSPFATGGWPAFAPIREEVLSFSGIRPGSIVVLEHERTTKPGKHRYLEIECRLPQEYPTLLRRIEFPGQPPQEFKNIDAVPNEPQSISWREQSGYLWYSDCKSEKAWARGVLDDLEASARAVDGLRSTAEEWTEGKSDPFDRAAALHEKLKNRLSIVVVPVDWMPDALRPADAALASHYASEPEAAALLLALFRAAGLKAAPCFVVADENAGPVREAILAYGVALESESGRSGWEINRGFVRDPGPWAGAKVYDAAFDSSPEALSPRRFGRPDSNTLTVKTRVEIDDKASWTASLDLRMTNLFMPESSLRSDAEKKQALEGLVSALLPDAELQDFTVTALSATEFALSARAKSKSAMKPTDGRYLFELPQEGPWARRFPIPLDRSRRETPLRLAAPFACATSYEIKAPAAWSIVAAPAALSPAPADHFDAGQTAEAKDATLTLNRRVEIKRRDIAPHEFTVLRDALNDLQTLRSRAVIYSAGSSDGS